MAWTIYKRHYEGCKQRDKGRNWKRCKCPFWAYNVIGGREIRYSLRVSTGEEAEVELEKLKERFKDPDEPKPEAKGPMSIEDSLARWVKDAERRNLEPATLSKYKLFERMMGRFAGQKGLRFLAEFDPDLVRAFSESWPLRNSAAGRQMDRIRSFFDFARSSRWIPDNPAAEIKSPTVKVPPTLPFSKEEMAAILGAADSFETKAIVLLMRYSGLRIGDAATLAAPRIQDGKLMLRTAKTGTVVYLPLPPFVLASLEAVKRPNGYFFWTGESRRSSVADTWRKRLAPVFKRAKIHGAHPHRFRDTFAVELLLAGVPLERVSVLLGHSSVKVTEKHYAPWVRDRQIQLEADVRRTWSSDLTLDAAQDGTLSGNLKGTFSGGRTPVVHGKGSQPN